jgi:hypothetical protein
VHLGIEVEEHYQDTAILKPKRIWVFAGFCAIIRNGVIDTDSHDQRKKQP